MKKIQFENESVAKAFKDFMKIDASIEEEDGKFAVAYCDEPKSAPKANAEYTAEAMEKVYSYFQSEFNYMWRRIDAISEELWKHKDNHLPCPKTPSQMQKAIDALGMGDDYEVEKKKIYASTDIEPLELA